MSKICLVKVWSAPGIVHVQTASAASADDAEAVLSGRPHCAQHCALSQANSSAHELRQALGIDASAKLLLLTKHASR